MRNLLIGLVAAAVACAPVFAPAASAKEKLLTLYSPKIDSLPYVHDSHHVHAARPTASAPGRARLHPGFEEMALVDSKNPKAKPLPIAKMMVHHFLYFAPGRVDEAPGGCWSGAGFIGGRGEEHPLGGPLLGPARGVPRQVRHREPHRDGKAPGLEPHRDGDEPLQEAEELLRPHAGLLHDREAHLGAAARDRQVRPARQRHVLRRARRRQEGLELRGQERLGRAVQRPDADGVLAPARRRQVPHARRASPASGGCSRRPSTTARRSTSTTRSARSCTSRGRSARARTRAARASRSRRARCCAARRCTTTTTCTWPRWASGPPGS